MGQTTTGLFSILSYPIIYDWLQYLMGAEKGRRELVASFIKPAEHGRILDIGCGTADILAYLPAGVVYCGYDISREYVEAARRRFGTRGHFHCGQIDRETLGNLPKSDIVLALGVLHHLDDDVAANLFALAREALGEGGRLVTIDPCLAAGQNPIARFLIRHDRGQNVRDADGYLSLARQAFPKARGTLRHRRWIPYTHWIMECPAC